MNVFSEIEIERIRRAFRLDHDAAVARLEAGAARTQQLADTTRREVIDTDES